MIRRDPAAHAGGGVLPRRRLRICNAPDGGNRLLLPAEPPISETCSAPSSASSRTGSSRLRRASDCSRRNRCGVLPGSTPARPKGRFMAMAVLGRPCRHAGGGALLLRRTARRSARHGEAGSGLERADCRQRARASVHVADGAGVPLRRGVAGSARRGAVDHHRLPQSGALAILHCTSRGNRFPSSRTIFPAGS